MRNKKNDKTIEEEVAEELTVVESIRSRVRQEYDWSFTPNPLQKVRYLFDQKYCEMLIEWMDRGGSFTAFAGVLKMPINVIGRWLDEEPSFKEASAIGESCYLMYWEEVNRQGARGEIKSNAAAMIFRLKNSFPDIYMDNRKEDKALPTTIIIHTGIDRDSPLEIELKPQGQIEDATIIEDEFEDDSDDENIL